MRHTTLRTAIALAVFTATAAYAAEATFDKTLSVSPNPEVTISTGSGYIHVSPGSDSQLHVIGHVHANRGWFDNNSNMDAQVKEVAANPPIHQNGNSIKIGEESHGFENLYRNISIDYDITLPKASTLKAGTGSGDMQIHDLDSGVSASSGSGDIKVQNIGANSKLETGSGSIDANGVRGAVYLETGSGDIRVQQTAAGDVKAQTGSGSIRANGVAGGLKAGTGSGNIEINGQPTSDWKLDTGSGSIHLGLGSGAKFTLNAETGSGTVHVDQPISMQGDLNKHHIRGVVNGGGPTIHAETGSGNITIK